MDTKSQHLNCTVDKIVRFDNVFPILLVGITDNQLYRVGDVIL